MNHIPHTTCRFAFLLLAACMLASCGTRPARNFGGSWRPANVFPERPTAIPLRTAYIYYAAPMDGTLKTMLTRWARDTQRELAYRHTMDLTLYAGVAGIHTTNVDVAVAELTRLYAAQGIVVTTAGRAIAVDDAAGKSATGQQTGSGPAPAPVRPRHPQPSPHP
ncbi:MAG: hypothetical protein J0H50_10675 [Xanthomonadales bacterium]|nr:hypothetical protein [Xanthomonadales bacterium]